MNIICLFFCGPSRVPLLSFFANKKAIRCLLFISLGVVIALLFGTICKGAMLHTELSYFDNLIHPPFFNFSGLFNFFADIVFNSLPDLVLIIIAMSAYYSHIPQTLVISGLLFKGFVLGRIFTVFPHCLSDTVQFGYQSAIITVIVFLSQIVSTAILIDLILLVLEAGAEMQNRICENEFGFIASKSSCSILHKCLLCAGTHIIISLISAFLVWMVLIN